MALCLACCHAHSKGLRARAWRLAIAQPLVCRSSSPFCLFPPFVSILWCTAFEQCLQLLQLVQCRQCSHSQQTATRPWHTYVYTHIGPWHTYVHTHIGPWHTYVHTHIGPWHTYVHTHIGPWHSYVHTHIGTWHTCVHTLTHTGPCMHTILYMHQRYVLNGPGAAAT